MLRYVLILLVLSITVLSQGSAPRSGEATITFYYPGPTPTETLQLHEVHIRSVQGGCISYVLNGRDIVYCGTFRLVKAK